MNSQMLIINCLATIFFLSSIIFLDGKEVKDAASHLKENFIGICQNNLVQFNGTVDAFLNKRLEHDNYMVYRIPISSEEWSQYQRVPHIYTWVHYNLSVGLQRGRQQAEEWQKPGTMQWAVAPDHPRQNKSNCIRVTQSVVETPGKLYIESRQILTEMYLLRKKHVLIHETGILASQCGYFQLSDTCETKFKFIGRKWWDKCKTQLAQAKISWATIFDPATSPLLAYEVDANGEPVSLVPTSLVLQSPFQRIQYQNPVLPLEVYNDTFPPGYNDSMVPASSSVSTSRHKNNSFHSHKHSTLPLLCRDTSYMSLLSKPWYPHWQYISDPVLVITAAWDCNYHHILVDGLSRIAPFIDFIRSSPRMKIHIRRHEIESNNLAYRNAGLSTRNRIARLLGIDPRRFISGPVVAQEILIPRSVKCNEAILYPLQMHKLTQIVLQEAEETMRWELKRSPHLWQEFETTGVYPAQFPFSIHQSLNTNKLLPQDPKRILIQHRDCPSDIRYDERNDWRCWTQETLAETIRSVQHVFPASEILVLSNKNSSLANCLACEITVYRDVQLLIGVHGAGMTNLMFFTPGKSMILEIVGIFDGRMLPVCGYHGPLAAIYGVHHVIHHYDSKADAPMQINEGVQRAKDLFAFLFYNTTTSTSSST